MVERVAFGRGRPERPLDVIRLHQIGDAGVDLRQPGLGNRRKLSGLTLVERPIGDEAEAYAHDAVDDLAGPAPLVVALKPVRGREEPAVGGRAERLAQQFDDRADRPHGIVTPAHGDAIDIEKEQPGWLIDEAVVAALPAAARFVCALASRRLALDIRGIASDQTNISRARFAQIFEQLVDSRANEREALVPERDFRILRDRAVAPNDFADECIAGGLQLSDRDRLGFGVGVIYICGFHLVILVSEGKQAPRSGHCGALLFSSFPGHASRGCVRRAKDR
jgi:hypothetical protein